MNMRDSTKATLASVPSTGSDAGAPERPGAHTRWVSWSGWTWAGVMTTLAVVLTGGIYWWQMAHAADGQGYAAVSMHMENVALYWAYPLSQAFGFAALIWSCAGVLLGLTLSAQRPRWLPLSARQIDLLHRQVSLTVIALILAHALVLLWDQMGDTVIGTFVPFLQTYAPGRVPESLGIIAFWLGVLLGPTYYLRRRLGPRGWRIAHRFTLVVYALGVWHTFAYGSDLNYAGPPRTLLWAAQIPVAAALRLAGRAVALATLAGVILVVVTGRIGGAAPPPPHHDATSTAPTSQTPRSHGAVSAAVRIAVTPGRISAPNTFLVTGVRATAVRLLSQSLNMNMGAVPYPATALGSDRWRVRNVFAPMQGRWGLTVQVQRNGVWTAVRQFAYLAPLSGAMRLLTPQASPGAASAATP